MGFGHYLWFITFLYVSYSNGEEKLKLLTDNNEYQMLPPRIFLPIIARNVEHSLPNWLGCLERLDYPKDRIYLWIRSDHNLDHTASLLHMWVKNVRFLYHGIDINTTNINDSYSDSVTVNHWSPLRFKRLIHLRQTALEEARRLWADYILFLDCDVFLTNPSTLWSLIEQRKTIVSPMIPSFVKKAAYSNFWCGRDEKGYYMRTDDYLPILKRQNVGCHEVVMLHSVMLIDVRRAATRKLYYDPEGSSYDGPYDDVMVFAHSVKEAGLKFYVLNKEPYGNLIQPVSWRSSLHYTQMKFQHTKLELIVDDIEMVESAYLPVAYPIADKAGFDEVFVINLARRPDRRKKMKLSLQLLGINATFVDGYDGKRVSDEEIDNLGIQVLDGYADPYHGRPVTKGEIGCFMSHFLIWEKMVRENLKVVMLLEDDIRFELDFRKKLNNVMKEAQKLEWDFMYLGRKLVNEQARDMYIPDVKLLVRPGYSWWTLGYVITLEGAKKLLAPNPLQRFVPVDEYIPIMFDQHPEKDWVAQFEVRDLIALSASPYVLYPTHYIGDEGYFSDTETSTFAPRSNKTNEKTDDSGAPSSKAEL
ncbi:procollagen galactosyltransferase 1-like [Xenia sp. Carnegie-2017]|uniref:procollagen galactosyltransferase 1-like n=1 Tax=Xenia sp. Carnegie-2017 TaxID=2897299 RepID=UPI001F047C64|nr:procollagen galactosyltransferase 1-like [Xenia sp. Carnegie-2017]